MALTRRIAPVFALAIACLTTISASAQIYTQGELEITSAWSRATPMVAPVAGGYVTITNRGKTPDTFLGGSSPVASKVEIHRSTIQNGVASMRPLSAGVTINPGETVEFAPGGTHLMFIQPTKIFKDGEKVEATLLFERAGEIKVEFAIQPLGARGPAQNENHQDHGTSP
ncbi:hypothetical protein N185_16115 [Sinorhizobium sp. GW3]|nr:hypothetical protein N185_16115 [Sinorhizobium sp. GW3]